MSTTFRGVLALTEFFLPEFENYVYLKNTFLGIFINIKTM